MYYFKKSVKVLFVSILILFIFGCEQSKKQSDIGLQDADVKVRSLYSEIEKNLGKVDFNKIWDGFSRSDFALYNQETVYLKDTTIPYDQRFLGNTAIDYNGTYIAVWSLDSIQNEDTEYLAADIVHEMFHLFQKQTENFQ